MAVVYVINILIIVLAAVIVAGKGDRYIAGYNTESEQEKQQVNIKRLRILVALTSVLAGAFCCIIPLLADNNGAIVGATIVLLCSGLAVVVLANTWARKK